MPRSVDRERAGAIGLALLGAARVAHLEHLLADLLGDGLDLTVRHSAALTGCTDSRLPRCRSTMRARRGAARSSASVTKRASGSSACTSTANQRGAAGVLAASKYSSRGSNWLGSGYPART